jgi:anti-anti-sigma factor
MTSRPRDEQAGGRMFALSVDRPVPRVVVVRVAGELDIATAPAVRETVVRHLDGVHLVLDLHPVRFFSGSAAQLLLDLRRRAEARGAVLHLTAPADRQVRQVLDLTGISTTTLLHDSVEAALRHLGADSRDGGAPADHLDATRRADDPDATR